MRSTTTADSPATDATANESLDRVIAGIQNMIAGFRCAGTGRLVKAGVSMTHMHVMWLLQHHGDLSMSRLAELLDVSFSNATGIIDRMEERGLVERVRVPDDRRVVLVRIGPKGADALEETEALKQGRLQAILAHLSPAQVDRVAAALDDIQGAVVAEFGPDYLAGHDHDHHRAPQEGTSN
jgi:DNA-binding MarR family transcriptional regulator